MIPSSRDATFDSIPLPHGRGAAQLTLTIGAFAMGTSEFTSMGLLPNIARDLHASLPDAGHVISAYALGVVVGAPLIAVLLARIGSLLVLNVLTYAAFYFSFHSWLAVALNLFVAGVGGVGLAPALQARLMDVAGDAQSLAASLNHSAFNIANALGAQVGALAIESGMGWASTGPVGAALGIAGLLVFGIALAHSRAGRDFRSERAHT